MSRGRQALGAAVEIGTGKALVADAIDCLDRVSKVHTIVEVGITYLIADVAECSVPQVIVWLAELVDLVVKGLSSALHSRLEAVARVVTKLVVFEAGNTEVDIRAVIAGNEAVFWKHCAFCQ